MTQIIKSTMFKFNTLAAAQAFANRAKGMMIVLGDFGTFVAVSVGDARRLQAAGYEVL